ncbi:DUF5753 domain-containing protein [Phytomonospora sp. NPDC050363]|uniref:DUF5753 domain-containing protein n=1 Tax=Phytomonospora sp. NPDC050363 TaxID=3155642 RepID=UPI0033C06774
MMTSDERRPSPAVWLRIVAAILRTGRQRQGNPARETVEAATGLARNSLHRYETAQHAIKNDDAVNRLFDYYEITGEERERAWEAVRQSRRRATRPQGAFGAQPWLNDLVVLESDAARVSELALIIPGRLQTEDYARAILQTNIVGLDVDEQVRIRTERGEAARKLPQIYSLVLKEGALRQAVGGADVMRQQLQFLKDMTIRHVVDLHVLPDRAGAHPSMDSGFMLLEYGDRAPQDYGLAYTDFFGGASLTDDAEKITLFRSAYRRLHELALPEAASLDLIDNIIEDLYTT